MIQSKRGDRVPALVSRWKLSPMALLLIGLLALTACGRAAAEPTGYFVKTRFRIVFVEWTETSAAASNDINLRGTITLSLIDRAKFRLTTDAAAFIGTRKGSAVSLTLTRPLDSDATWTGTLSGSDLTLNYIEGEGDLISLRLKAATRDTFNTALVAEQRVLSDLKSGKLTFDTEEELMAGIDKLSKDVSADLDKLSKDVETMTAAVAPVTAASSSAESYQSAAHSAMVSAGKHQYGPTICPFADAASSSANAASGAASAAAAAKDQVLELVSVVKADLFALSTDHGNLAGAQAELPSYKPKGVPTEKEIDDAITAANDAMEAAEQGANGGARSAASKASSAQSDASQAQAKCAAAPQVNPSPKPTKKPNPDPSPQPSPS